MATKVLTGNETFTDTTLTDYVVTDNGVGSNTLTLGDGTDKITLGSGGNNTVTVGNGNDTLVLGGASNTITTGTGNSLITTSGGDNTIVVGSGSNTITLGDSGGSTPDTVHTGAGNNIVFVTAAAISGDTLMGALTSGDGTTNQLVLTTTSVAAMSPVNVSGFASYQLADGGPNSLTLAEANFARLPGGSITVIGGNSGNTVNAAVLSAAHSVTIDAGAGTDLLTGGGGNDRFVFAPSNLAGDMVDGRTGTNTLELMAGGTGTLNGLGTNFKNISTVVLDANATWTLGIGSPTAFGGTISGFVSGDAFDLTTLAFNSSGSATLGANNQLQVTENGTIYDINLNPMENFAGDVFHLASDGSTGTFVTESLSTSPPPPPPGSPPPPPGSPPPPPPGSPPPPPPGSPPPPPPGSPPPPPGSPPPPPGSPPPPPGSPPPPPGSPPPPPGSPPPPPPGSPPPPPPPGSSSELLWQSTTGEVDFWAMQGTAAVSTQFLTNPGTGWHLTGAANFGDGTSDLLWQSTSGEVDYWTMQGNAAVSTHVLANPGTGWHLTGPANFGDGTSDLLWQSTSGEVDYWTMQGTAAVSTHVLANPGTGWHLTGAANFGDGTSDLLWQSTSGEVDYWTMQGNAAVSTHVLANPGTGWHLVAPANFGDGTSDLLWQSTSGEVDFWTMHGNAAVSTHFLANPGTGWQLTGALGGAGVMTAALANDQTASPAVTAGGTGSASSVIIGVAGQTVAGGSGATLINGTAGSQAIAAGSGATTVWGGAGDTITGGSGQLTVAIDHVNSPGAEMIGDSGIKGSDTVTGFSQAGGDRIFFPNDTTAAVNSVVASAQSSNGNTLITLPDGATMTLIGTAAINSTFFA